MLNEEKIRLMAKAAAYEAHKGKKAISVNHFFCGDYISINLIWGVISYTITYGLCLALWALYRLEYLMDNIHKMDLMAFGKKLVMIYAVGLAAYMAVIYFYYSWRYRKNRKSLSGYYQLLKRISAIYEEEGKAGSSNHTAGGT